jgi:hypothetical protein
MYLSIFSSFSRFIDEFGIYTPVRPLLAAKPYAFISGGDFAKAGSRYKKRRALMPRRFFMP